MNACDVCGSPDDKHYAVDHLVDALAVIESDPEGHLGAYDREGLLYLAQCLGVVSGEVQKRLYQGIPERWRHFYDDKVKA